MVNVLYQIFTDKKLNYAVKLDGVGVYRSIAAIQYADYNTWVGEVKTAELDPETEQDALLDLVRPFAITCTVLPP